jgi:hypothetical protein
MNEEQRIFNETQPIKQTANIPMLNYNNFEEESEFPTFNSHSTYMKIAIKYKLPPDLRSVFKILKLGNSFGFCPDINGDPIIVIGPHWPFFLSTFVIITIIFIIMLKSYINNLKIIIKYIGWILYIIWGIFLHIISLKNPGYPKTNLESIRGSKQMFYCDKCELWNKPKSHTYHCNKCDICIEEHKFHCLITGHCIGRKNKKEFYWFVFVSIIFLFYFFVVYSFWKKSQIINYL